MIAPTQSAERAICTDETAERHLLCIALVFRHKTDDVLSLVQPTDFWSQRMRDIHGAMVAIRDRREDVTIISLRVELDRTGVLARVGGDEGLVELESEIPSHVDAVPLASRIRELAQARQRYALHARAMIAYNSGALDTARAVEADLANDVEVGAHSGRRFRLSEAAYRLIDERSRPGVQQRIVRWGFGPFDAALRGGQRTRTMAVIGASPGVGKSTLTLSIALGSASCGYSPGIIACEDEESIWAERGLAHETGEDVPETLDTITVAKLVEAAGELAKHEVVGVENVAADVEQVERAMVELVREEKRNFLLVDYLQSIRGGRGSGPMEQMSGIASRLKRRAAMLDVPLVLCSQLSRPERGKETVEPEISRLRYSGDIEAMAEVIVMAWHSEEDAARPDGALDKRPVWCRVSKLKWGPRSRAYEFVRLPGGLLGEAASDYRSMEG